MIPIKRALLSVYDKRGIVSFAQKLVGLGVEIISTGGTYRHIQEASLPVTYISEVTQSKEILEGRVKSLHPAIHGGILARRNRSDDMQSLKEEGIEPIDLVAVNLYPFEQTVSRPDAGPDEILEMIDIGGPTLLRAAAKNHRDVLVVVNPQRFEEITDMLQAEKEVPAEYRRQLALEAFRHTAQYDAAICRYFESLEEVQ